MASLNGIDEDNDINLSGESNGYFDTLDVGTFQGVDGTFFTGITSNIQTQINGISGGLSSTYVTLATAQNITGAKSFNSVLPTSTVTPTTGTQLITKTFGDSTYGQLAVANTWTQTNTFSRGIVPRRFAGDQTDYQISSNAMINRQAGSVNNIGIGISTLEGDNVSAGYFYNTGSRNTACGHFALQKLDGGNDSVAIGYQALQNAGGQRIYGAGITPNRCVAIGAGSQKTNLYGADNISIGFNSLNNVGSGSNNIILGSNVGNGLGNVGSNVVIGTSAMPTAADNGIVCIGLNALRFATGQCNRGVFIGESSGQSNNNGSANTFLGGQSGTANTTGSQNICIGTFSGRLSSSTSNYMVCIGYDSKAIQSNEFVLGGESFTERAELTLPNKTRLACNQSPTGVAFNLAFRTNENVQLTDATTTTINLPSPTSNANIGTKFYINRQVTGGSININAPAGQTIRINQVNGSSTTFTPYIMNAGVNNLTLLCIGSTAGAANWLVIPPAISQGTDSLYISSSIGIPATHYSIPFGGLTTSDYYPMIMDNANLKFQPSTGTLTTTNLNITNKVNIQNIQSIGSIANLSLSFGTNENVLITSTTTTSITLPTPTASNIGSTFNIYKTYTGTSIITVIAPSTQHILADGISSTTYNFGYNQTYLVVSCIAHTGVITWTARGNNLFLARNDSSTITGTYTFSTNPIFNNNSIPTTAISGLSTGLVDTTTNQSIGGTKTFTSAIVVPDASIPTSKIIGYGTTQQIVTNSANVNYPVTFTTLSTGGTFNAEYGNANMTYNPSTSILTTPNLVANNLFIGGTTIYSPYESKEINSNGNMSVPLAGLYFWAGAGSNNINLPTMTADMVGARVVFCRTGTNVLTNLTINRSGTDVIYPSASGTTSNTIVLLTTNSPNIWRGEIMALSLGFWAVR
jgi:hypothetical protein